MANVLFKRGTQSSLNTLITNGVFTEGAFYLTSDTNRLYFAQSNSSLAELNQFIHIYTGDELPSASNVEVGDFYYWTNNNILLIYTARGWIQINPDTRLESSNNALTSAVQSNAAQITVNVSDDNRATPTGSAHTATGSVKILGGSNVHVTAGTNSNEIVISADNDTTDTSYTIRTISSESVGKLNVLNNLDNTEQEIQFIGTNGISVTSNANKQITISGHDPVSSVTNGYDTNGNFKTQIGFANGGSVTSASGFVPTISYGGDSEHPSTAVFNSGIASLSVYTKDEIDDILESQMATMDAMTFKGLVNSTNASTLLTANDLSVGDTFKASSDIEINNPNISAKTGDLIIATGTDNNITWEVVPSGDEQLLTVVNTASSNLVQLKDSLANNAVVGALSVQGDTRNDTTLSKINVAATASADGKTMTFNVQHGAAGTGTARTYSDPTSDTTSTTGVALDIPTISSITLDSHGHVSAITTSKYRVTDTHASISANTVATQVNNDNTQGSYSIGYKTSDALSWENSTISIQSSSLKITKPVGSTGVLAVNLEWGSF